MDLFVNKLFDDLYNNLSTKFNHSIIIWFNDNYERIEGDSSEQNVLTYLSLKEIFFYFQKSIYYQTLT